MVIYLDDPNLTFNSGPGFSGGSENPLPLAADAIAVLSQNVNYYNLIRYNAIYDSVNIFVWAAVNGMGQYYQGQEAIVAISCPPLCNGK